MKITFSTLILFLLLLPALSVAQNRLTPEERTERLKERLSLTDEQAENVLFIYQMTDVKIAEEMKKNLTDEERRNKMIKLMENIDKQIESLLTEEQKVEYEKLKAEMKELREKMRNNRGGGRGMR